MNDPATSPGASDAETIAPLAADPSAGTDDTAAAGAQRHATSAAHESGDAVPDGVAALSGEAPSSKTFWANLNHPFGIGISLTLGGLVAIALGLAFWNLSTIIIYIVFALFAALGLDPVVRWL